MRRMPASVFLMVMSSSFFNPGFAFNSHFDTDGAPLSELSWSSSLAIVAVSISGLFTFIFLMLACLCCKKGDIGFKEFENGEGEEYQTNPTALGTPASQDGPEVYVLPLTELSLPVSTQSSQSEYMPERSSKLNQNIRDWELTSWALNLDHVQLHSSDVDRHSLLYLKEMGHGWFGKVLLGEVTMGHDGAQVVVKELKASASVQEQMQFLEEVRPYCALQHPALVQCLAQCSEVTPYLLVMEFCALGDLKGYLRSCRAADSMTPDPSVLQRMACDIASGLLHLHKYNYIHSDLALRNCLTTAETTVKIGDYGLSHNKYKDDYFVTPDQLWVPLRWIAPEIVDEVHGNLLVADQTKASNVWSLGVTIWELFELGNQPYRHYSDRQVLTYAVKEQQLKLPKPLLKVPLSERWYEVMQFCWLQPDQRPSAEEVHLLLTYLSAKSSSQAEGDFEERWNSLRPMLGALAAEPADSASSSFPLLERFSTGDAFHTEAGDEVLTVTETHHGLTFEYKWEQAPPQQPPCYSSASGMLGRGSPRYQDACYPGGLALGVSPSFYEPTPGVVPVLSAHSPSVSSEYYIRIEEPAECCLDLDCSPGFEGGDTSSEAGSADSGNCGRSPAKALENSRWSAGAQEGTAYGFDSPTISFHMKPLSRSASSDGPPSEHWDSGHKDKGSIGYHNLTSTEMDCRPLEANPESWGPWRVRQPMGEPESPLGISLSLQSPQLGWCDPFLGGGQRVTGNKNAADEVMGSPQGTEPGPRAPSIDAEMEGGLLGGWRDHHAETCASNWSSNHSSNNNSLNRTALEGSWPEIAEGRGNPSFHTPNPLGHLGPTVKDADCVSLNEPCPASFLVEHCANLCREVAEGSAECCLVAERPQLRDPPSGPPSGPAAVGKCPKEKGIEMPWEDTRENTSPLMKGSTVSSPEPWEMDLELGTAELLPGYPEARVNLVTSGGSCLGTGGVSINDPEDPARDTRALSGKSDLSRSVDPVEPASEGSQSADFGAVKSSSSSMCTIDIDCSDQDGDDDENVTAGIFMDLSDTAEVEGEGSQAIRSLRKDGLTGTPDSMDAIDLPSTVAFSPASFCPSTQPKALDSGYDTENNESPEFIPKEAPEPRDPVGSPVVGAVMVETVLQVRLDEGLDSVVSTGPSRRAEMVLTGLREKNPYRESAYFSDYDAENDRWSREEDGEFLEKLEDGDFAGKEDISRSTETEQLSPPTENEDGDGFAVLGDSELGSVPILSTLSPYPPEMGGCLTKESSQDEGLGLDSEHSGEEPSSECSSSSPASSSSSSSSSSSVASAVQQDCSASDDRTRRETSHSNSKDEKMDRLIGGGTAQSRDEALEKAVEFTISSSVPRTLVPMADGEEADEEDGDSDDSEGSDEELRCYNVHEQSEESEEEFPTVVVVSDRSDASRLRSLLKMPSLLTQSFCDELDRKKKAVSFFDDVTVYLFDQESPTGDLSEYDFPPGGESSGQSSTGDKQPIPEKVTPSDDSSDGTISEESGGFEWEDDFPLMASPPSALPAPLEAEGVGSANGPPSEVPETKPANRFSRFSVSRFSITHVSDSDLDSVGGSSEDGE